MNSGTDGKNLNRNPNWKMKNFRNGEDKIQIQVFCTFGLWVSPHFRLGNLRNLSLQVKGNVRDQRKMLPFLFLKRQIERGKHNSSRPGHLNCKILRGLLACFCVLLFLWFPYPGWS